LHALSVEKLFIVVEISRSISVEICTKILYDNYMKCALYARVSTSDQCCEMQLGELRRYCAARGWAASEYVDEGFSGKAAGWATRPALQKLLNDARARRFDAVLVWKLDRFGRSLIHLVQSIQDLTSWGVRFVALVDNIDTEQSNPMSRLMTNLLGSFAEYERELIKERTVAGIRAAKAAGKVVGRPKRVFDRSEVVRLRDEAGLSWRSIAKQLGIPAMTAVDAYRQAPACTETVLADGPISRGKY
jgi:putative DNA-invertase from lambdoid prophage Rac